MADSTSYFRRFGWRLITDFWLWHNRNVCKAVLSRLVIRLHEYGVYNIETICMHLMCLLIGYICIWWNRFSIIYFEHLENDNLNEILWEMTKNIFKKLHYLFYLKYELSSKVNYLVPFKIFFLFCFYELVWEKILHMYAYVDVSKPNKMFFSVLKYMLL